MKSKNLILATLFLGTLAVLLAGCPAAGPTGPSGASTRRVNAGGPQYVDGAGVTWSADNYFSGGVVGENIVAVSGTTDDTLYQTERGAISAAPLTYTLPVNSGTYQVTLKFAEIFWNSPGQRVWDVYLNGSLVLDNYDAVAAVGVNAADDRVFNNITPVSGNITVALISVTDNAKISAIQVIPMSAVPTATPTLTMTATPVFTLTSTATPTLTPTATLTSTATATATATGTYTPCASGNTIGSGSINSNGGLASGYTMAGLYVSPASQTLTHVQIRGAGDVGALRRVGLYSSSGGLPFFLITAANYQDGAYASTISVPIGPVALTNGTSYWFATTSMDGSMMGYPYFVSASGTMHFFAGSMPNNYPGSGTTVGTNLFSVQGFLCP